MASVLLLILIFGAYAGTICPTVYLGDSGELTAAAFSLGIPHNSGYPLYALLGKLFCLLPIGNVGFRMNVMSAVLATATLWILYSLVREMTGSRLGAFFSTLILAFVQVFWSQTASAEVYTLHIFFVALLIRILYWWDKEGKFHLLGLFVFLTGLSFGNHMQTVMLAPPVLSLIFFRDREAILNLRRFVVISVLFVIPLLIYLYLPVRTDAGAAITWGDPNTWDRFLAHVSGRSHRASYVFSRAPAEYLWRTKEAIQFIASQFGLLLALAGWGWLGLPSFRWKLFFALVVLCDLFYTVFLNIISLKITAFNLPTSLVIAILCGNGITRVVAVLEKTRPVRSPIRGLVRASFCAVPAIFFLLNFGVCNQGRNYSAYEHVVNIFRTAESGDILFMNGDNYVFPILYGRIVEKMGEGVTLFDRNNIFYKWLDNKEKAAPYSEEWKDLRRQREWDVLKTRAGRDVYYAVFGPYAIDLPSSYSLIPYGVLHKVVKRDTYISAPDTVWSYYSEESFYGDFQRDFMTREVTSYYHFNRGKDLFMSGQVSRGAKTIMLASKIGYDDELIHSDIAIFFIDRGLLKEGKEELEKALLYHEDLSVVYNNWGYYYHKIGDYRKAADFLEKAVELKPNDTRYLNNWGLALLMIGKRVEALRVCKKSLDINPRQPGLIRFMEENNLRSSTAED